MMSFKMVARRLKKRPPEPAQDKIPEWAREHALQQFYDRMAWELTPAGEAHKEEVGGLWRNQP